jgi:N-acetyl-anhydromuramyl-L-alanine amidase AmpD
MNNKLQRILILNTSGDDVKFLQEKLKEYGFFNDKIDGYFGQNTLVAVTNFQQKIGVHADGNVSTLTWNKLLKYGDIVVDLKVEDLYKISFINQMGLTIYDNLISEDNYEKEEIKKDTIILYNSAGCYRPDFTINGLEKDFKRNKLGKPILDFNGNYMSLKIATSYVIGRSSSESNDNLWDGTVFRSFDDKYWAYHINSNSKEYNSRSIGIKICNYGALVLAKDGKFYNYANNVVDNKDVIKLNKPYRGYEYYERYTDKQIENIRKLIIHLINKYNIQIDSRIYNENWFNYDGSYIKKGIRNHSQICDDKFNVFPQKEMIDMLNSI